MKGATDNDSQLDLSILRQPISTSITGFQEVMKAYENGTDEVRQLLSFECDIIYECKVCRNIFRSLANFLSHKRVYCRSKFNSAHHFHFRSNGFIDEDISTIIQAEEDYTNYDSKDKAPEIISRDLGSIIERLVKKQQTNRVMKLSDFYEQVENKLTQSEIEKKNHVLKLDKVPNSNVAVYQTVQNDQNDDIKKEVFEVDDLLLNNKIVLGPDGKAIKLPNGYINEESITELTDELMNCELKSNICEICNEKFSTEKMLKLHIKAKHISSTYVYQCPSCSETYLQPSAVIRHLSNDHKKSFKRIRLMRDSIFKRRFRMDEVQIKGPSRELARLQTDKERVDAENKAWMGNLENFDNTPVCTFCGKTFERRAVLTSHMNSCRKNKPKKTDLSKVKEKLNQSDETSTNSSDSLLSKEVLIENVLISEENSCEIVEPIKVESEVKSRKRKRNRTNKVVFPSPYEEEEEAYWSLDESGTLTVKKFIKEIAKVVEKVETKAPAVKREPKTRTKDDENEIGCIICDKKFGGLSNLKRHVAMFHYRQKKFACKLCEYRNFRKFDIIYHLQNTHAMNDEKSELNKFLIELNDEESKDDEEKKEMILTKNDVEKDLELKKEIEKKRREIPLKVPIRTKRKYVRKSLPIKTEDVVVKEIVKVVPVKVEEAPVKQTEFSPPSSESGSKRPIRNRIKAINKDFVYDLSNLLKKDADLFKEHQNYAIAQSIKSHKHRRNTIQTPDESFVKEIKVEKKLVIGAALRMAELTVSRSLGKLNQIKFQNAPVEIKKPAKIIQARHSIAANFNEEEPIHQRRISVDSLTHLKKRRRTLLKSPPLPNLISLTSFNKTYEESLFKKKPESVADFDEDKEFLENVKKNYQSNGERISVFQRLAENKNREESLYSNSLSSASSTIVKEEI